MHRLSEGSGRRAGCWRVRGSALALACAALACGPAGRSHDFETLRVVPDGGSVRLHAGSAERFGFAPSSARRAAPAGSADGSQSGAAGEFAFAAPEGWQVLRPDGMRALDLAVTRDPRAECYLTVLTGDGGGLAANVDRWRAQMGLAPLESSEYARLERSSLLGQPALKVDFEGRFSGMDGAGGEDYRLVGLLAVQDDGSHFLKFVGPTAIVTAELEAFDSFAASLRLAARPLTQNTSGADSGLIFVAPAEWRPAPARPLREVTFHAGERAEVECYVAVLGGDGGGGVRSNLDRWRAQMGQAPLAAEELAELEHVPALGVRAVLIEVAGDYRGMGGEQVDGGMLLGAVALLEGRTVFVKLIGPAGAVALERERFRAFVTSLEVRR